MVDVAVLQIENNGLNPLDALVKSAWARFLFSQVALIICNLFFSCDNSASCSFFSDSDSKHIIYTLRVTYNLLYGNMDLPMPIITSYL